MTKSLCLSVCWAWGVPYGATAVLPATTPTETQAREDASQRPAAIPPRIQIAAPSVKPDDRPLDAWITGEFERLCTDAENAEDPVRKAELLCASANHLLAYALSPQATCQLLRIPPANAECGGDPGSFFAFVDRSLEAAATVLATLRGDDGSPNASALRRKHETLSVFAASLRVALDPGADSEARRAAVSRLSPLREDPDPAVSSAAGLWQAYIRSFDHDTSAVKAIVGTVTADPRLGTLPYTLFGRLLRCRLLAEESSPPAAVALLLQVEELAGEWFSGPSREPAIRACGWVRLQVLQRWQEQLSKAGGEKETAWCEKRIEELTSDLAGEPALLPLAPAVPILVPPQPEPVAPPPPPEPDAPPERKQPEE